MFINGIVQFAVVMAEPVQGFVTAETVETLPVENVDDTAVALRVVMERHRLSYRAVNDVIDFVRKKPTMEAVRNIDDVLQRSKLPTVCKVQICSRCHDVIEDGNCISEEW